MLQPLAVADEPGLDALDPRFNAITSLASRGQYSPAADQVEALFDEGIYDIRLISIYLLQAFREAGIIGLGDVLAVVDGLLGESFEAVGPVKKREETFDRRVAWLFGEITDTLEYHATKQTPEWSILRADVTADTLEAISTAVAPITEQVTARRMSHAARGLARLEGWLAKHMGALVGPVEAPVAASVDMTAPPSAAAAAPSPGAPAGDSPDVARREISLVVSHRFLELTRKLRAFEALVQKRQFRKAALVADDLQHLIENFDPRSYFPEVFADFSAQLSENIGPLAEHWEERESIAWKALGQFYQTDLERFVKG
ncbi:MAG: type VI secretion system protein IglI family protein [Minicystis sp.]